MAVAIPAEQHLEQGAEDGLGFTVRWLQSAGNGSFVADAEKMKNSILLFQIKKSSSSFFSESKPSKGRILTTNSRRNNAPVVLCDTQSQKTVASSYF